MKSRGAVCHLRALVMMQLKDKLDLSFLKSKRSVLFRAVLSLLLVACVTAVIYLLFSAAVTLRIFSFWAELPVTVVSVVFFAMFVLSALSCTIGLTDTLFLSKDNPVLLTLPVPANMVFLSKLVIYYIYELRKNVVFTLPLFIAYGMVNALAWYFYPWLVFGLIFVSMLPVLLGAVLSIPSMYVYRFVKRYNLLKATLFVAACAGATWAVVEIIRLIPENINIAGSWGTLFYTVQDALNATCNAFLPLFWLVKMLVGQTVNYVYRIFSVYTLAYFGGMIGAIAVIFLLVFFVSRPLFFRMASKEFEFAKKDGARPGRNRVHGKYASALSEEFRKNFRSGRLVLKYVLQTAVMPVAILLLNRVYAAMNTRLAGEYMTIAFNVLIMMLLMLSFNAEYASVYSRDGNARHLLKTRPVPYLADTLARLFLPAVCSLVSVVASLWIYASVSEIGATAAVLLGGTVLFATYAHLLWSAEMDIMNPQSDQYATVGVSYGNPNERNSALLAFGLSAAFTGALYFLIGEGMLAAIVKIFAAAAVFLGARVYLYCTRVKLYYAEK